MSMKLRFPRRRRRGANALEYALTLPFFLLITFGMMEYGWFFAKVAQVNGALAQSCREGSLIDPGDGGCGDSCITDTVEALLIARLNSNSLSCVDCSAVVTGIAPDRVVECTAIVQYSAITGYLPNNSIVPSTISTASQVRLEWQRIAFP